MALAASRDVVQTYLLKMVFIREPFYELEDFFLSHGGYGKIICRVDQSMR